MADGNAPSIPVLTLHQPWATLIALGVKTIETRSWSTKYRGPIAIHAGTKRPPMMHLPPLHPVTAGGRRPPRDVEDAHNRRTWLVIDTITDDRYKGPQPTGRRIPRRAQTPTLFRPHAGEHCVVDPETGYPETVHLPLGEIVATAELVDVLPIVADRPSMVDTPRGRWISARTWRVTEHRSDGVILSSIPLGGEAPFGDYRPGRWAWMLGDVRPLAEPLPFRGGQALSRKVELDLLGAGAVRGG